MLRPLLTLWMDVSVDGWEGVGVIFGSCFTLS